MRRRDFISLLGGAAVAWPIAARAQQPERVRRIGVLMGYPENDLEGTAFFAAFREGLDRLGWVEDRNTRFDTRWATADDAEARQRFAKELVALQPDLILSNNTPTTAALLQQTRAESRNALRVERHDHGQAKERGREQERQDEAKDL